jgi:hypothetical protein
MSPTHNPCAEGEAVLLASPFTALQYHFGMLLGVEDLETAQAYPRGKLRLHNAWLHGEGVIWGLNVLFNERRELAVDPGLAVDLAGRELHLDHRACLDIGKWYKANKDEPGFRFEDAPNNGKRFTVHVVARFKACLARPVPAIADQCEGAQGDTAYSRVLETVELLLRPGRAPVKTKPYHRLRVLFQLEADSAAFDDVRLRREAIQAANLADQPAEFLKAFREFAALDAIDLKPQQAAANRPASIFPEEPAEVVLADLIDLIVEPEAGDTFAIVAPLPNPDVRVRPALVATSTIQELLNGPLFRFGGGGGVRVAPPPAAADAGGPRIDPAGVVIEARKITLKTSGPLAPLSVDRDSIDVSAFDDALGWREIEIKQTSVNGAGTDVTVELKEETVVGQTVRLIVRGTGSYPVLGQNLIPLAGAIGGPAGSKDDGHDFVLMAKRV